MIDPAPDTRINALRVVTIKFDILNRLSGDIQFTADIDCAATTTRAVKVGRAVLWGLKNNADLQGADLWGADLQGADLQVADLQGANLSSATLSDAKLWSADLSRADLRAADLSGTELRGANHLFAFGPIGKHCRMGSLSIDKVGEPIVHLGCFMGSEAEALAKISRDYGETNTYGPIVAAMCAEARRMVHECKAPESEAA